MNVLADIVARKREEIARLARERVPDATKNSYIVGLSMAITAIVPVAPSAGTRTQASDVVTPLS